MKVLKDFTEEFKVHYVPVLFDLNTRQERREELLKLGAKIDFNSMDRKKKSLLDVFNRDFYSRVQPICLSGYLVHWKRNFFNVKEDTTPEKVVSSIRPKLGGIGTEVIAKYFEKKGLNLQDILSRRN